MTVPSFDANPYAPPDANGDSVGDFLVPVRSVGLRSLIVFQTFVILVSLGAEAWEHETIVFSGPVFFVTGLLILIVARRREDPIAAKYGGSAMTFALFIVFLINYNSWGPVEGDLPITVMSYVYAAVALPLSAWLVFAKHQRELDA